MIVCHCVGATDRTIREAIQAGATTVKDVARCTGAGRCCASCREEICDILLGMSAAVHTRVPAPTTTGPEVSR